MAFFDFPLEKLRTYKPKLTKQNDFEEFWLETLKESAKQPLNPELEKVSYPAKNVECYKIFYNGFKKGGICGWFLLPKGAKNIPAILELHGYSGKKANIFSYLSWVSQGYAVLSLDIRGQTGESSDGIEYFGPQGKSWITKGITDPHNYYYRFVYVDCFRAVNFILNRKEIDPKRIAVIGVSQGGGLALITSGLCSDNIKVCVSHIPFLCHFNRAITISTSAPYLEINEYIRTNPSLKDKTLTTLSYFDVMNFADKIKSKTLVTVGLEDIICPPSTIFATYNNMKCKKEIVTYDFLGHDYRDYMVEQTFFWIKKYV